jgi:hypothetical protein
LGLVRVKERPPVVSGEEVPRGDGGALGVDMPFSIRNTVSRSAIGPKIGSSSIVRSVRRVPWGEGAMVENEIGKVDYVL